MEGKKGVHAGPVCSMSREGRERHDREVKFWTGLARTEWALPEVYVACRAPNCRGRVAQGSYCNDHTCWYVGCLAPDFGPERCARHNCRYTGCCEALDLCCLVLLRSSLTRVAHFPSVLVDLCEEYVERPVYCRRHGCTHGDCLARRGCPKHTCSTCGAEKFDTETPVLHQDCRNCFETEDMDSTGCVAPRDRARDRLPGTYPFDFDFT